MDLFQKCYDFTAADEIRAAGLFPYFRELQSRQDTEVIMEGKRRIMLGSNNYLGLTTHPEVIAAGMEAFEKYGSGCSGSRLLNGTLELHLELEKALAAFLEKEDVVTFSTGFQSNLGIISALVGRGDYVICDRDNHASIYDACRLSYGKMTRYRHNDMADLEKRLREVPETAGCLIVTDGVFSMGGDIANLPEICRLARQYGARLMVDDAHGLGVIGKGGRGTASYFGLEDQVDVYMGTFSKSLASLGGYMAAEAKVIDYVRVNSRPFIFSASITPASCACAMASLKIIRREPERVQRLSDLGDYFRAGLKDRGLAIRESSTPIIPIYTYDRTKTLEVARDLFDAGVYVNTVLPPAAPAEGCMLRTSLMATHTHAQLDEAMDIIRQVIIDRHHITGSNE